MEKDMEGISEWPSRRAGECGMRGASGGELTVGDEQRGFRQFGS